MANHVQPLLQKKKNNHSMKRLIIIPFIVIISFSCAKQTSLLYPSGKIKEEFKVNSKGEKHGVYKRFYKSGILRTKGVYKNGMHHGIWKSYHSTGELISVIKYEKDSVLSVQTINLSHR